MAPTFSREVEEATVEASGSTSLINITDADIRKIIDYVQSTR
jgi:hypothetical protein